MRGFRVMAESAQALQQRFRHHPQCAVELNVSVNAVNGTRYGYTFSFSAATLKFNAFSIFS